MQLDHRLFEAHQYALINPLQIDKRIALLWPCEPIVPKELLGQEHLLPYLLKPGEITPDARLAALDETVQYARDHGRSPFSALLKCDAGSDQVRNHLARMMVRKFEGEQMLFRYYDPRVWNALEVDTFAIATGCAARACQVLDRTRGPGRAMAIV